MRRSVGTKYAMVIAIVLGIVLGIIGFLPLFAGLQLTKKATSTSNLGQAGALLLGVLISFVVLAASLIACIFLARDFVLPFTLSVVGGLVGAAIGYGLYKMVRK